MFQFVYVEHQTQVQHLGQEHHAGDGGCLPLHPIRRSVLVGPLPVTLNLIIYLVKGNSPELSLVPLLFLFKISKMTGRC